MAILEHVELDTLRPGMPVVVGPNEVGRLEDVIPQPDRRHAVRLIVRRSSDDKLIRLPIEWVRGVEDGRIALTLGKSELRDLPEYVPLLPAEQARQRVQHALDNDPRTRGHGIQTETRNGRLELRGVATNPQVRLGASTVSRGVPGVGVVRNFVSSDGNEVSAAGYAYPWLHDLVQRATGLDLDDAQLARAEDIAEQKLVDLFDVAEEAAAANGRTRVLRHDVPVTKGLQIVLLEVADLSREFELQPLLVFLSDAGIRAPIDESLYSEIPALMAAMLIVVGRTVDMLEPSVSRPRLDHPSPDALERASALLDLTL